MGDILDHLKKILSGWICLLIVHLILPGYSQVRIQGVVKDNDTKEPLNFTNIQIVGTYRGTTSNAEGRFNLFIPSLPAELHFRYIGYESFYLTVTESSPTEYDIGMKSSVIELPALTVTGEDPGMRIMARVIEKKKEWRKMLESYKAEAYTRTRLENDTSIASISESTSDVFWNREKGLREIVRSKRETSNLTDDMNFAFAGIIPNFYDDDIDTDDFLFVGPTHPKALKYYHFKRIGERSLDDQTVVDIEMSPKSKLQPLFSGRIAVLLEEDAMIEVEASTNEAMMLPPPVQTLSYSFRQQFSNFGQEFWLPVDVHMQGEVKIGMTGLEFPPIRFIQSSRIADYQVNVPLPDSLYKSDFRFHIDSIGVAAGEFRADEAQLIPLTVEESQAYEDIDSTMTLFDSFRPTGFIGNLISKRADERRREEKEKDQSTKKGLLSGLRPRMSFNRVDGYHVGATVEKSIVNHLQFNIMGAYKTASKKWAYGGGLSGSILKDTWAWSVDYSEDTRKIASSRIYPTIIASLGSVVGRPDIHDFYRSRIIGVKMDLDVPRSPIRFSLGFLDEKHESLEKVTDWSLFGKRTQKENPAIDEGELRSITASFIIGDGYIPWGPVGQNRFELRIEHADPDFLGGEFGFTRAEANIKGRLPTFLRRRLLPLTLELEVAAGISDGVVPVQRLFTMDGRLGAFTPFGAFKSLSQRPPLGDRYIGIFWEHHFRTVPFEILGLRGLAKRGYAILVHGASGRTWLSDRLRNSPSHLLNEMDEWIHEVGVSISGVLNFFRIDFTRRLDKPSWSMGLSVARLF